MKCVLDWVHMTKFIWVSFVLNKGRESSVGIATRYGLEGPGIESRWGARFSASVQTGPGAPPASCTVGTGSFPGVKLTTHPHLSVLVMKG